jgi:hypothetical protein
MLLIFYSYYELRILGSLFFHYITLRVIRRIHVLITMCTGAFSCGHDKEQPDNSASMELASQWGKIFDEDKWNRQLVRQNKHKTCYTKIGKENGKVIQSALNISFCHCFLFILLLCTQIILLYLYFSVVFPVREWGWTMNPPWSFSIYLFRWYSPC